NLPRWLARSDDPARRAMGNGFSQDARGGQRLQMGALQHRRGLFGEQRSRGKNARQAARTAATVSSRGAKVQRIPVGRLSSPARSSTTAQCGRWAERFYLFG